MLPRFIGYMLFEFALEGRLAATAERHAVPATFDNGVLTVRIPKPLNARRKRVRMGVGAAASKTLEGDGE